MVSFVLGRNMVLVLSWDMTCYLEGCILCCWIKYSVLSQSQKL
jgi:hypothetical protein